MNRLFSPNSTCTLDGRPASSDDSQVGKILESYLQSLERGQSPDIDALLQQHSDLAEKLEPSLRKLAALHRMSERLQSPETADPLADAIGQDGTLGDYRIIREIGRGGMGIVYEAHQISLSRRVALKVLPFAAVLDPRHLQRFKNEALAAASLDHPNIVEVYGVGCERGVHFYAMRYVEGQTLAAVIDALRLADAGTAGLAVGGTPTVGADSVGDSGSHAPRGNASLAAPRREPEMPDDGDNTATIGDNPALRTPYAPQSKTTPNFELRIPHSPH
ncbi:MAG: protein kinase [Pirellulales bacterium]